MWRKGAASATFATSRDQRRRYRAREAVQHHRAFADRLAPAGLVIEQAVHHRAS